ncbi:hypothetical protein M378DRAFT_391659 [Amanita muscaria Koide BX008]|uniref:Peptidase metallopeptidase domain-containing protein n=1 Tax=Amanita muscaria (strain Koide BX008) TaxID=946122 RepID=A0A0C2ST17_AMAMK|nr:hypothetical protein M378DRAFT_391659 [Amanita muscaria Koide BX008]
MFEDLHVKPLQRACYSTVAHSFFSTKRNHAERPATGVPDKANPKHSVMSDGLWGFPIKGGQIPITYKFFNQLGSVGQKEAVKAAMAEWERYANVVFKEAEPNTSSDLRIAFNVNEGSWSVVGKKARDIPDNTATMNLGWLPALTSQQTKEDIGTILHELGHALGMLHEHQSPARGGTINLKLDAVYSHFTPLLQNDQHLVLTQVIDKYNADDVDAFSRLDSKSIMMYPMDRTHNEENINVPYNPDLSEIDRAFIMLTYPGREDTGLDMSLKQALQIAAVPANGAKEIQALVAAGQNIHALVAAAPTENISNLVVEANKIVDLLAAANKKIEELDDEKTAKLTHQRMNFTSEHFQNPANTAVILDLTKKIEALTSQAFEAARYQFFAYNKKAMASYRVNKCVLNSIDRLIGPSQGIIFDKLGAVVQHPVFKDVLNIIVNKVLAKHGIPSNTKVYNPDMTGEDVLGGVRSLLMNHAVKEKVVEVQMASVIIGDVHKIVVDVEKLPGKILDFLRNKAAQPTVDLLKQPSWMRCTVKNATEFSIVLLNSHFEQGAYHAFPLNIRSCWHSIPCLFY